MICSKLFSSRRNCLDLGPLLHRFYSKQITIVTGQANKQQTNKTSQFAQKFSEPIRFKLKQNVTQAKKKKRMEQVAIGSLVPRHSRLGLSCNATLPRDTRRERLPSQKLAIFPSLYFRENRPGKCVKEYSTKEKSLSTL